jgi:hypothetical protein
MASVNLSSEGEQTLEQIRESFEIQPSKRRVVETALQYYWEERKESDQ